MATGARLPVRRASAPKRAQRSAFVSTPAPIVKWAGGKTKLLKELMSRAPDSYRRYFEPFMGGGALYFRLAPKAALLNDRNTELVSMYKCVAFQVEAVIKRVSTHRRRHSEEHYYRIRDRWNSKLRRSDVERAATFIYLNKTCYNGLWRVNSKGEFNVPMGRYKDPKICDPNHLRATAALLRKSRLITGNYADCVVDAGAGDFVYFDPPYHPVNATANFTSYTSQSFNEQDQQELADLARRLARRGCHVMLSNSDTPFIRKLYKGFRIDSVQCARAINSKAARRGKISEIIATNR